MQKLFKQRKSRIIQMNQYRKTKLQESIKEIPDDLFQICGECSESILFERLVENHYVCPKCHFHQKMRAYDRVRLLCDENTFEEIDHHFESLDEEQFFQYRQKLDDAKLNSQLNEAVVCGIGKIHRKKIAVAVMDSHFMMGSMGHVVGDKITRLIELATKLKLPLCIVSSSGGARMQEGIISLMQMAKTSGALKKHSDKGLLYISLLTNPTTGGVSASFAMLGDIIIAEPNALIGFAGKRVIEQTIKETLPEDFQSSEFLMKNGFVDMIVDRKQLKAVLSQILDLHEVK